MWEWSKQKIQNISIPARQPNTSLLNAYDDLLPVSAPDLSTDTQPEQNAEREHQNLKSILEQKLREYNLSGFTLLEKNYHPQFWTQMDQYYEEYQHTRTRFLKLLAYSALDECSRAGLSEKDISLLKEGIAPENYNTHLKIPFDFGGKVEFGNYCLIKTHPQHDNLHKIIELQISNGFLQKHKKLFIPWFEGKICHD